MKFAIVADSLDCMGIAHQLHDEGNDVYIWIRERRINKLRFRIKGTDKWKEVEYEIGGGYGIPILSCDFNRFVDAFHDADFLFEGSEHGKTQDQMRAAGLPVVGSSSFGDKGEENRYKGIQDLRKLGIPQPWSMLIKDIPESVEYIKKNKGRYIIKQNGNLAKSLNWAASEEDSSDLIYHLMTTEGVGDTVEGFVLQKYVEGTEIAAAGWFAGTDWIKQNGQIVCEVNYENKPMLHGGTGPTTGELGTGAFISFGMNEIFRQCLLPLTDTLRAVHHVGCVDANCIVTDKGEILVLEDTDRFGYPITSMYPELLNEPFGDFLHRVASGETDGYNFNTKRGVIHVLSFPVYPYEQARDNTDNFKGEVLGLHHLTPEERKHVHLEQTARVLFGAAGYKDIIADEFGYACTVSYADKNFVKASEKAVEIIKKIVPYKKGFFRADIGEESYRRYKRVRP